MAVSVVHFNTTSSPHKVLQQNTTNNNNSNERREIIILRKNPHILPQPKDYNNKEDILITNPGRKKAKSVGKEIRTQPQPVAVARRNARERNRVKQVNNGFANLRQRIPNFIAAAFESSTRGGSKKLSKVETLRMAVEYIRSLEDILADDNGENGNMSNSSNFSTSSINTLPSYPLLSPSADSDDLSSTSTPPPPQYIRIDTATNTYQIISGLHPHHHHDLIFNSGENHSNSENLDPISSDDIIMADPGLIDGDLGFGGVQDLSLINSMSVGAGCDSLSPGIYSEQSLSPGVILEHKHTDQQNFLSVFQNPDDTFKVEHIKSEVIDNEVPVISLKTENELPQQHKDNVIDVMQWWEHQAPNDTLS